MRNTNTRKRLNAHGKCKNSCKNSQITHTTIIQEFSLKNAVINLSQKFEEMVYNWATNMSIDSVAGGDSVAGP
jgi:hypothetical protein